MTHDTIAYIDSQRLSYIAITNKLLKSFRSCYTISYQLNPHELIKLLSYLKLKYKTLDLQLFHLQDSKQKLHRALHACHDIIDKT